MVDAAFFESSAALEGASFGARPTPSRKRSSALLSPFQQQDFSLF